MRCCGLEGLDEDDDAAAAGVVVAMVVRVLLCVLRLVFFFGVREKRFFLEANFHFFQRQNVSFQKSVRLRFDEHLNGSTTVSNGCQLDV